MSTFYSEDSAYVSYWKSFYPDDPFPHSKDLFIAYMTYATRQYIDRFYFNLKKEGDAKETFRFETTGRLPDMVRMKRRNILLTALFVRLYHEETREEYRKAFRSLMYQLKAEEKQWRTFYNEVKAVFDNIEQGRKESLN